MSGEDDPGLPGELDWSDEVEEVESTHSDANFRDTGREAGPHGSPDQEFSQFARKLHLGLSSSRLFTVTDGFTTHRIAAFGVVREGADLRVLFYDPMRDTFLREGHNAADFRALMYFPSTPLSFTPDPMNPHPDPYARSWSMTVEEMNRVFLMTSYAPKDMPFRRKPLKDWHARHLVTEDRVTCLVHGPHCSFRLPLDAGLVTITGSRGGYRWDVYRQSGYGVFFEAGRLHAPLPSVDATVLWDCILPRLAEIYPYEVVAEAQSRIADRLTGEPILLVALNSHVDPPGPRPAENVVRVAGPVGSTPDGLFSHDPHPMGPEVVFAVTATVPYILFFVLRGHAGTWDLSSLLDLSERMMVNLLVVHEEPRLEWGGAQT